MSIADVRKPPRAKPLIEPADGRRHVFNSMREIRLPPAASATPEAGLPEEPEEVLVADIRAGMTPTDMVERKLVYLLRGAAVAASHVRMGGPRGRGGPNEAAHRTTAASW
jgi:hypothetical protein